MNVDLLFNLNMAGFPMEETETEVLLQEVEKKDNELVLHNDDYNTFDHVIESLQEICSHNHLQAEQCAYIVHYNGKCSVEHGAFDKLKPMCTALLDRGLSATIE